MTVQPLTATKTTVEPSPSAGLNSGPGVLDDGRGLIRASLDWLRVLADPLAGDPWGVGPLTVADITDHHDAHPVSGASHECPADYPGEHCRGCEIRRIAYLVEHGWPEPEHDPHPIIVDVGVGTFMPMWPIVDGNHRVAAAIVRGQACVDVEVGGDWRRAVALLCEGHPIDLVLDGDYPGAQPVPLIGPVSTAA